MEGRSPLLTPTTRILRFNAMKMLLCTILLAGIMVNMAPEAKAFPMQNSSLNTSSTASPQLSYITSTTPTLLKTIMVDLKSSGPATTMINTLHTSKISSTALSFQTPSFTTPLSSVTTQSVSQSVNSSSTAPTISARKGKKPRLLLYIGISVGVLVSIIITVSLLCKLRRIRAKRSKTREAVARGGCESGFVNQRFKHNKKSQTRETVALGDCELGSDNDPSILPRGLDQLSRCYECVDVNHGFEEDMKMKENINTGYLTPSSRISKKQSFQKGASVQVHVPRIQAKEVITVDGGTLETENATLQIGPGCLTKDTHITMIMDNHHFAFKSLLDLGILSVYPRVIEFLPDGLKFESPADLTVHLEDVVPSDLELFALHGAYSKESERIIWEVLNGDTQVNVNGQCVNTKIDGFCFYTYIMSTRGRLPRILSHLNNTFYCDAVALYRRLPASPFIEVAIVLVSQFVKQNEQLAMMINKNRYREGATGARERVKTDRCLEVCLEFPGMDAENSHIFKPDACRLDTVGMVFDDFPKITQGCPTGGKIVIREIHRNSKRRLWTLDIYEEIQENPVCETEVVQCGSAPEETDDCAGVKMRTRKLSNKEINRLSRLITMDWDSLAGLLDIPYDERDEIRHEGNKYPDCRSKAEKILSKFNESNSLSRKLLIKCLTILGKQELAKEFEEVKPDEPSPENDVAESKVVLRDNTRLSPREMHRLSREIIDWDSLAALMEIAQTERQNIRTSAAYHDLRSKAEKTLSIFNKSTTFCRQKLAQLFKENGLLKLVDIVKTGEYRSLEMVQI